MTKLKLKSSQWIVDDQDRIVMGEGRLQILDCIDRTGSINQAAKMLKMSYKSAWSKIQSTQKHLQLPIVETDRHKGTRLTAEGRDLIEKYRRLKKYC